LSTIYFFALAYFYSTTLRLSKEEMTIQFSMSYKPNATCFAQPDILSAHKFTGGHFFLPYWSHRAHKLW